MNNIDRADRFIQMAEKFINIFATEKTRLDFSQCDVVKHTCGTVACHGGYALLALKPGSIRNQDFDAGSIAVGKFLGFEGCSDFEDWAQRNPTIWGSENGELMFCCEGPMAFGRTLESEPMNLGDIAAWYLDVAKRLLGQKV